MSEILIVGGHGQDGKLLAEKLQRAGNSVLRLGRADIDISNESQVARLILSEQPREVYYLAAHHHSAEDSVKQSDAELFVQSMNVHVCGVVNFLEGICRHSPATRLFYAASSHVFGYPKEPFQNESTPFNPCCVYGITKTAGIHACRYYRQARGVFSAVGILYNHESHYRAPAFVSQKIVRGALAIKAGEQQKLVLGSLSARIDWGYALDYVEAMTRILALPEADDFVIATGETHSVQEFVEIVFGLLGLEWRDHVVENSGVLNKPPRVLAGDASKLREATAWNPTVSFTEMVELLLRACRRVE